MVVKDREIKRKIREAAEAEERESYEHRMPADWLEALAPLGTDWRKEFLETAPYLIVVFRIDFGLTQTPEGETKTKHYYVQESVGIATGFLLAALHMSGLATLNSHSESDGISFDHPQPAEERAPVCLDPGRFAFPRCDSSHDREENHRRSNGDQIGFYASRRTNAGCAPHAGVKHLFDLNLSLTIEHPHRPAKLEERHPNQPSRPGVPLLDKAGIPRAVLTRRSPADQKRAVAGRRCSVNVTRVESFLPSHSFCAATPSTCPDLGS